MDLGGREETRIHFAIEPNWWQGAWQPDSVQSFQALAVWLQNGRDEMVCLDGFGECALHLLAVVVVGQQAVLNRTRWLNRAIRGRVTYRVLARRCSCAGRAVQAFISRSFVRAPPTCSGPQVWPLRAGCPFNTPEWR